MMNNYQSREITPIEGFTVADFTSATDPYNVLTVDRPAYQAHYQDKDKFNWEDLKGKIFKCQFMITTRRKWTYTDFDFEHVGIFSTGDIEADLHAMDDWTNTTRCIADLVEMYDEGKEFIIPNPRDIEAMFNFILDYTEYVGYIFSTRLSLTKERIERDAEVRELLSDIVKMQNFANRIFPMAVSFNKQERPALTGILGFLNDGISNIGVPSLTFNPVEKYGFTKDDLTNEQLQDKQSGMFKAVDVSRFTTNQALNDLDRYL